LKISELAAKVARVDQAARRLLVQFGDRAVHVAIERLNDSIDQEDRANRNFWAQVVHAIHERLDELGAGGGRRVDPTSAIARAVLDDRLGASAKAD